MVDFRFFDNLKEKDIRSYYIYRERERGREVYPASPQCPGHVPDGPLKVLTARMYRGATADSQWTNTKIDDLMIKLHFFFLLFTDRTNIHKF